MMWTRWGGTWSYCQWWSSSRPPSVYVILFIIILKVKLIRDQHSYSPNAFWIQTLLVNPINSRSITSPCKSFRLYVSRLYMSLAYSQNVCVCWIKTRTSVHFCCCCFVQYKFTCALLSMLYITSVQHLHTFLNIHEIFRITYIHIENVSEIFGLSIFFTM